jgi:hypothetical protein
VVEGLRQFTMALAESRPSPAANLLLIKNEVRELDRFLTKIVPQHQTNKFDCFFANVCRCQCRVLLFDG